MYLCKEKHKNQAPVDDSTRIFLVVEYFTYAFTPQQAHFISLQTAESLVAFTQCQRVEQVQMLLVFPLLSACVTLISDNVRVTDLYMKH